MNFIFATMMIAIPVSENNMDTEINDRFGRSPFFCFYDTITGKTEFRENNHKDSAGGVGPQVAEFLGNHSIKKALAVEFGPKAKDVLNRPKIETQIIASGQKIRQIIEMLND